MNNNTLKTAPLFLFDTDKNIHEFYNTLKYLKWRTVKECFEDVASYYYAENGLYIIRIKYREIYSFRFCVAGNPRDAIKMAVENFSNVNFISLEQETLGILKSIVEWDVLYPVGDDTGKGLSELNSIISRAILALQKINRGFVINETNTTDEILEDIRKRFTPKDDKYGAPKCGVLRTNCGWHAFCEDYDNERYTDETFQSSKDAALSLWNHYYEKIWSKQNTTR